MSKSKEKRIYTFFLKKILKYKEQLTKKTKREASVKVK
jgi:hypothetical protein